MAMCSCSKTTLFLEEFCKRYNGRVSCCRIILLVVKATLSQWDHVGIVTCDLNGKGVMFMEAVLEGGVHAYPFDERVLAILKTVCRETILLLFLFFFCDVLEGGNVGVSSSGM
jgi:hypothetical protein